MNLSYVILFAIKIALIAYYIANLAYFVLSYW